MVSDIVRVIRSFRPDVIITRFSPQGGGHGHHTASAILAIEAFKLAGDPAAFPVGTDDFPPWKPKRILQDGGGFGRGGGGGGGAAGSVVLEIGGDDPVSGESLGALAGRSRSMHKSQGFGDFAGRGGGGGGGRRSSSFTLLAGEPAKNGIMDGVDTTWARVKGGSEIARLADEAVAKFDLKNPAASLPRLLAIRKQLASLPPASAADAVVTEKSRQLDRAIEGCLGLVVETTIPNAEVVPGEVLHLKHSATIVTGDGIRWLSVSYPATGKRIDQPIDLAPGRPASRDVEQTLPATSPLSHPYWLRADHSVGLFTVDAVGLIGRPETPAAFPITHQFQVGDQTLSIGDTPVAEHGQPAQPLEVIAPVTLRPLSEVRLFAPAAERRVDVEVTGARDGIAGTLDLRAGRMDGCTAVPSVPAGIGRRPHRVVVQREGTGSGRCSDSHGRSAGRRPHLEHRACLDPARAHPRAVAPAPRAAEGCRSRPGKERPSRRLHPGRRR